MCQSKARGGRRCLNHKRLQQLGAADLAPQSVAGRPDAVAGGSSAGELYDAHGRAVAGPVVARVKAVRAAEPAITGDVLESLPAGTRADGLEYRMKSPQSLARKVADRHSANPWHSPAEHLAQMTDVVRYTMVSRTPRTVFSDAEKLASSLQERGWTVTQADHSYTEGAMYKGVHFLARHPSGETVELQAHSEESMRVKALNHVDYEVLRDPKRPTEERLAARRQMHERSAALETPRGLGRKATLAGVPVVVKQR